MSPAAAEGGRPGAGHAAADMAGLLGWIGMVVLIGTQLPAMDFSDASPPSARRVAQVDTYHGTPVADPWRWMEDTASAETSAWVAAQNRYTEQQLAALPGRAHFATRLRALLDHERMGLPQRENGVYAWTWNPGQAEQDLLRISRDPGQAGAVLVDPASFSADGTASLGDFRLSPDGRLVAWSLSDGGSDWKTWRVRDTVTGQDTGDVLTGTKFTSVSWSRDGMGFYYSRYPTDAEGRHDDSKQVAVYYHLLGTDQAADRQIYAVTDHPTRDPYAELVPDGRFLVITLQDGYETSGIYYQRLTTARSGETIRLLDRWDGRYEFLGAVGEVFYFLSTQSAPLGQIIAVSLSAPEPGNWRVVVPEAPSAIASAALIGGRLVVEYVQDAHAELRLYKLDGSPGAVVQLPGQGSVTGFPGTPDDPETFLSWTDFTTPRTVMRLDAMTGALTPLRADQQLVDAGRYLARQVFYTSRDGTRVPMHIVHRKDLVPDGRQPTVLYGYGGFNVSLMPAFSAARMAWIEAGGVYVQANLRGGGEYGEAWHQAGTRLNKQNVFDDFIAAAEWLVANGITSPAHLAIWGGSNGGSLVAAVLNQRPELFAAAVPAVGVLDMLRYQTASLNARKWGSDFGLSDDPAEFAALRAWSPYHNIRQDYCYPPVLVQADANDDRVVAWHSYKYAAALQAAQSKVQGCRRPVLIRIETRAGHGAGASVSKLVDEYAAQWAFVAAATGLTVR
ncbi:MAG: prolyl oligopeptidase family serine peptidase [Gammaproteobacteria bacterium]